VLLRAQNHCGLGSLGATTCGACQRGGHAGTRHPDERWLQQERLASIGRLTSGVAHDFNNLVTAILGFTRLALTELDDDGPTAADLREVVTAAESASSLARQLLTFANPAPHLRAAIDIGSVCQDVGRMLRRVVGNGIELSVLPSPDPLMVLMERHRLEQVVVNLVMNARDAMPGGGRITLTCDAVDLALSGAAHTKRYARLRVVDTGAGIAPEVLPHVFEPFFTTRGSQGGTGLGLASCYQIVSEAAGEIAVSASSAFGTEFTVLLPSEQAPEASDGVAGPPA
jgi:two-component system cell cycle sensor histidine kinase/response regulator CckA